MLMYYVLYLVSFYVVFIFAVAGAVVVVASSDFRHEDGFYMFTVMHYTR